MKLITFTLCAISAALAASTSGSIRVADDCNTTDCTGSDCYCSITRSPVDTEQTPQFIVLTFSDAVTEIIYTNYLVPMLQGRLNADGSQIGATFYVPHEYTDYECVNSLYNMGFEIAVHTISTNSLSSYWSEATIDTLVDEFGGQKTIISTFANIPTEDITGARVPNLEMAGNQLFEAYQEIGIEYDNTWVALSSNRYFPYTLDYLSTQPCNIGICPDESFPGVWELPIIDLVGVNNIECNSIQACSITGTASEVSEWLMTQFNRHYEDNRAPMTLVVNSAWFATGEEHFEGFLQFLDNLQSYSDVFLASHRQVIEWMRNPQTTSSYQPDEVSRDADCQPHTCELLKGEEYRYMKSCISCPSSYPWLGNHLGQ